MSGISIYLEGLLTEIIRLTQLVQQKADDIPLEDVAQMQYFIEKYGLNGGKKSELEETE